MKPCFPRLLLGCALAAAIFPSAQAMEVQPPTFPELVAEASVVARARVAAVASRFVTNPDGQRSIRTFVTFTTLKAIKGEAGTEFTLSFLGGTADDEKWEVPGMPAFRVGDEEFVFTTTSSTVCPLVGAMHGRYHVLTDAGTARRYVARNNLAPLTSTDEISHPLQAAALPSPSTALSPDDFERRITAELAHPSRAAVQP